MAKGLVGTSGGLSAADKETARQWMVEGHDILRGKVMGTIPAVAPTVQDAVTAPSATITAYSDSVRSVFLRMPLSNAYFAGINWIKYPAENLRPEYIKKGVNILGVTGTMEPKPTDQVVLTLRCHLEAEYGSGYESWSYTPDNYYIAGPADSGSRQRPGDGAGDTKYWSHDFTVKFPCIMTKQQTVTPHNGGSGAIQYKRNGTVIPNTGTTSFNAGDVLSVILSTTTGSWDNRNGVGSTADVTLRVVG